MQNKNDSFSQKLFRFLVRLLPFDFRINYQGEMEGVFREQQREVAERGGFWEVLKLWKETIVGIFTTAPREHWEILVNDCAYAFRMMRKNPVPVSPPSPFSRWPSASAPIPPFSASFRRCCCAHFRIPTATN